MTSLNFNSKTFAAEGFEPQPVPETLWPVLSKLNPRPLDKWAGYDITDIREMRKPMMEGVMLAFATDKIEKINLGYLIFMKRMVGTFLTIFPAENYDFPVFSSELIENPGNVHFLLDLHPLQDLVIKPDYRTKYLDPIEPLFKEYSDVHNDVNPNVWWRSFLSPFAISGRHKPEAGRSSVSRIMEVMAKYLDYYVTSLIPNAEPVSDAWAKDFAARKKAAMRHMYQTMDPGAGPLVRVMGVEGAKKMVSVLF